MHNESSKWIKIRSSFDVKENAYVFVGFESPEDVNGTKLANVSSDGNIVYLDENVEKDEYAQRKIDELLLPMEKRLSIERIKIKYFTDGIEELRYIDGKSDWIDLRSAVRIELKQFETAAIPLGVAMEIPSGYEAHVAPRSSTMKQFGIMQTNSVAVIDECYNGDNDQWFMPVIAMRDTVINVNDRICQFRIIEKQPKIRFHRVNTLGNKDRGGHGSTGRA